MADSADTHGENNMNNFHDLNTEDSVIHQAVGILRQCIFLRKKLKNEYFSAAETSVSMLHDWVDPLLYKTILWLTDEKIMLLRPSQMLRIQIPVVYALQETLLQEEGST